MDDWCSSVQRCLHVRDGGKFFPFDGHEFRGVFGGRARFRSLMVRRPKGPSRTMAGSTVFLLQVKMGAGGEGLQPWRGRAAPCG
jgi:hypothetical protein